LSFPEDEWICLPATIERLNKEFNRKTKPMEILAGERSYYTLPTFFRLKTKVKPRSKPLGEVPNNLFV